MTSVYLDIYGYRCEIRSDSEVTLGHLSEDFEFFRTTARGGERVIELSEADPPYATLPPLNAVVYTPRNVSYRQGELTYVDYSGRALGISNSKSGDFHLYSRDTDLLYEAAYLFLLSQCGESFDEHGLHRVHALGISLNGRAALVLLPMGGGKSTLGSHLLHHPDVELLSDDSPLIDHKGVVHAFPLRLGFLPGFEGAVPKEKLRLVNRMEFGPKILVNYAHFADRVRAKADAGTLFLGSRSLSSECTITPAGRIAALREMLVNCVVGMGLFQGMEFVFQRGPFEVAAKAAVAWKRLMASWRLISRSEIYHLSLGRDNERNAKTVHDFLLAKNRSGAPTASGALESSSR